MRHIPNLITSLNLAAGFFAIIFATQGDLVTASWLIVAAMIFDFLDGFSARLLKAYSDIGKELDSLADVVSFGVAPGLIIFHLLADSLSLNTPLTTVFGFKTFLYLIVPAIMPVCAALRLAIFNTDTTQSTVFRGIPTPANAIAVISLVIAAAYSDSDIIRFLTNSPVSLVILTVILSLLMVSRIKLLSLKTSNLRIKGNEGRYLLVAAVIIAFAISGFGSVFLIIPFYLLASFIQFRLIEKTENNSTQRT